MSLYNNLLRFASSSKRISSRFRNKRQKRVEKKIKYFQTKRYGQKLKPGFRGK